MNPLGAIILAGGRSSRMGENKALMLWDGERAIDRVARLAREAGADPVWVAGCDYGLPFIPDEAPDKGPASALLAAARNMMPVDKLIVLAVDAPQLALSDIIPLLAVAGNGAIYDGLMFPMCVRYEALMALGTACAVRDVVSGCGLEHLDAPTERVAIIRGANTPAEAQALGRQCPENERISRCDKEMSTLKAGV